MSDFDLDIRVTPYSSHSGSQAIPDTILPPTNYVTCIGCAPTTNCPRLTPACPPKVTPACNGTIWTCP